MTTARISTKWAMLPLIVWLIVSAVAITALSRRGDFRSPADATSLYDSGTRAAQGGDHARAVLDLRRAQRLTPGLLPVGGSLAARLDGNLTEVRARIAAAPSSPGDSPDPSDPAAAPPPQQAASATTIDRPASDRILAAVRMVPWPARVATTAVLLGLLIALAAMRAFCIAAGMSPRPPRFTLAMFTIVALLAACFSAADRVLDSRRVEAVLLQPEVARSGPDNLTYPPAVAAAFPAGTEFLILGANEDGRWVRVAHVASPRFAAAASTRSVQPLWLPRNLIEQVDAQAGALTPLW